MKSNKILLLLAFVLTLSALFLVSPVHASIDGGYVGTATCLGCHDGTPASDKTSFMETGHPWKYEYTGGQTPPHEFDADGIDDNPLSGLFTRPDITTDWINTTSNNDLLVDDGFGKLDWSAINYTVGGFGWKIRWGVRDPVADGTNRSGYVWSGLKTQNNIEVVPEGSSWSAYPSSTVTNKKYSCAICHNTNGTSLTGSGDNGCMTDASGRTEPWASNTDLGMSATNNGGYFSEWTFDGVQCEACHGPGEGHSGSSAIGVRTINTGTGTVEICAQCHVRSKAVVGLGGECGVEDKFAGTLAILTSGAPMGKDAAVTQAYVGHHEQYNEMHGLGEDGVHASLTCTTCHDPHKRAAGVVGAVETALGMTPGSGSQPAAGAIIKQCGECHIAEDTKDSIALAASAQGKHESAGVTCVDCHMAEATKTATAATAGVGAWGAKGDLKTHIFKISPTLGKATNPAIPGTSFNRDNGAGKYVAQNAIPVVFACGKCHDAALSSFGEKGATTVLDEATAKTEATDYHGSTSGLDHNGTAGYVGSNICSVCHTGQYDDFAQSGHPYKVRITDGATPTADTDPLSALLVTTMPSISALPRTGCGTGGTCDSIPDSQIDGNSDGKLDWSAVSYVIGGYGWKARWGIRDTTGDDMTGYVWASPSASQYNMLAADITLDPGGNRPDWSAYPNTSVTNQTKLYQCAKCHNTNGVIINADAQHTDCKSSSITSERTEPWASTGATYGTPGGFRSEWTFSGVQCEACHGPASAHIKSQLPGDIVVDTSKDVCGKCHIRATNTSVTAPGSKNDECSGADSNDYLINGAPSTAGKFNGHHEQYNELVGAAIAPAGVDGVHASLDCVSCHNPHKRSHKVTNAIAEDALGITDNALSAEARGAVVSCESCHGTGTPLAIAGGADTKVAITNHVSGTGTPVCIDCHMAEATQSATGVISATGWGKMGDVKTHIFKIDPTQTANTRLNDDLKTVAANYITVDYACGKCHDSTMGNSYVGYPLDRTMAQNFAVGMHSTVVVPNYGVSFTLSASGLTVNVDATVDCGGTCPVDLAYDWNWGDATANGTTDPASHLYTSGGSKTIKLTVSSPSTGGNGSYSRSVTLANPNGVPVAGASCVFTANTWTLAVTDTSTDDGPDADADPDISPSLKIVMDWGDGLKKTKATAGQMKEHTYTKVGTFSASLKAIDDKLQTNTTLCADVTTAYFTIGGTVTKSDGTTPLSSASVQLLKYNRAVAPAKLTSAAGAFSFGNLKPGTYQVKVTKSGYTFPTTNVTVGPDSLANVISAN